MSTTPPKRVQPPSCILALNIAIATIAKAVPQVAFPFNSQVPTVARVNEPYSFQLSSSTFTSNAENLTYTLADQPAWLAINSATHTISGTPASGDIGPSNFLLTAVDSTGASSMQCTLVVSDAPAPKLSGDVANQLATTANLSSSSPPVVTLLPSTTFHFDFHPGSFIDIVQRKLYYYATLIDHTPLPSWLSFDDDQLTFSGTAPELSAFPQSWTVDFIVSDVEGFAGTAVSFTIAIGMQQLVFVPEQQDWNVASGRHVSFTALRHQLFLNGKEIDPVELKSASADIPGWLVFNASMLAIGGTAPEKLDEQTITISVADEQGNMATSIITLVPSNSSLFDDQVGTIFAQAGKPFTYHIEDSLFGEEKIDVSVEIPQDAKWLSFDATTRNLSGAVPSSTKPSIVQATLIAKPPDGGASQSQVFTIEVEGTNIGGIGGSTSVFPTSTKAITMGTSTPATNADRAIQHRTSCMSSGTIAAIVISSVVAGSLMLLYLFRYCRKRRQSHVEKLPVRSKKSTSHPFRRAEGSDAITATSELQRDVEKNATSATELAAGAIQTGNDDEDELPQQIQLTLPIHSNRNSKWKRSSHVSQSPSLGIGEGAIRANCNTPELGEDAVILHTPHRRFAISADIGQVSRQLSRSSPAKRAPRRIKDRHRSQDSINLGMSTVVSRGLTRHSSDKMGQHRRRRSIFDRLSTTGEASSIKSFSTRGTSVMSTRPSEFPIPPSTYSNSSSLSTPNLSDFEADSKRKSIRLVEHSDSVVTDDRPIADKRQSFIRNGASVRVQSPLFAHGSRASASDTRQTGNGSVNGTFSVTIGRTQETKRGKSTMATYPESSSLESQSDDSRRSRVREAKCFSQKVQNASPPKHSGEISRLQLYRGTEEEGTDSSWTSESMTSEDFIRAEIAKPQHETSFVLPGEASPTPLPVPSTSRQQSESRHSTTAAETGEPRQQWRQRLHDNSSSLLSSQVSLGHHSSRSIARDMSSVHRDRLREPISLVSADSIRKGRPQMAHTPWQRPISMEEVQPGSTKAEQDTATTAGSEQWEDFDTEDELEEAGLVDRTRVTSWGNTVRSARSDLSGPAFL